MNVLFRGFGDGPTQVRRRKEKFKVEPAFLGMAIASGLHLTEEFNYPGGFLRWICSVNPRAAPSVRGAVIINAAFFALVLSPFVSAPEATPVFSMSIAGLLLVNGALHIAGTFLTGRYSPGAVTSVLGYFPTAIYTLMTIPAKRHMGALQVILAILLGVAWQLVPLVSMVRRRSRPGGTQRK